MSDVPLLRNKSGTARDRDPSAPVEDLEFEAAIGRNVRQLRLQHGLTVAEMAARVGISKAMMSKIENAQTSCSLSTLALLAKVSTCRSPACSAARTWNGPRRS